MRLVYGVGINDLGKFKTSKCPFYDKWRKMLYRCYSEKYKAKNPSYETCTVYDEWKYFSSFKAWMLTQDWEGKELDKDLFVRGNKEYSATTCCFLSHKINCFMTESLRKRGELPIGVSFKKSINKYMGRCNDGNKVTIFLGYFNNPQDAHLAWKKYKHELACTYAEQQTDQRIAEALRTRYL